MYLVTFDFGLHLKPLMVKSRSQTFQGTVSHKWCIISAVMAQWLECRTRNHKVASSSPATGMSAFGDWFTQP